MQSVTVLALATAIVRYACGSQLQIMREAGSYKQPLHNFQNTQYFADFVIGGQEISGIFDTGSFEVLVMSTRCESCIHPTSPYNHSASSSYLDNGTMTKHVFGSGPCISRMGYETVSVGPMTATKQAFWEITSHDIRVLDTAKFGAIIGIGPQFAFGNTENTLLMNFGVQEFSVCLQKPAGSIGFLTWGPVQTDLTKGDYASAQIVGKHHWATPLHNVTFIRNSAGHLGQIPCGNERGCAAIVDSGTSLIAAPGSALMQLSTQLPPIKEDCSNLDDLPTLHLVIDGTDFELPPQAYVMRITGAVLEAEDIWDILFFKPKIRKVDMCMFAFMQMDMISEHGPVWILGMPFFRYYHTTFDREKKEMRFARAGPNCEPEPFKVDKTESLLAMEQRITRTPMDVNVASIIPPSLSEQIDKFPAGSEIEL